MAEVVIRGTRYPVLLPKLRDPRLHLAATITSLQVIGQVGFHFDVSIAQILLAVGTCALLEVGIAFRTQHVLMWPASAMLTGNGVAFVLRVPGTQHGDWWSLRGWWIFVGTAAVSLLSKHLIRWRGEHIFNPSNIGLVLCFLILGRARAVPLDFWWGPMSWWLALALAVIVTGGFAILRRLGLLRVALGFWVSFAAGIGLVALAGHAMIARWHLGPVEGFHFWWVLVTSPEVLVFLFFMITDPKTAPRSARARLVYAVTLGLLASALIAPTTTEYAAKVALLGTLSIVCLGLAVLRTVRVPRDRRVAAVAVPVLAAAFAAVVVMNGSAHATPFRALPAGALPPISILPSRGVQTQLDRHNAELIAHDLLGGRAVSAEDAMRIWLEPGQGQDPPVAVAELGRRTYRLATDGTRWRLVGRTAVPATLATVPVLRGYRFKPITLPFREGAFRYGVTNDPPAMMGGGLCWLDFDNDGWLDLFVVNSYGEGDIGAYSSHGGLPRTALFRNEHGRFVDVTARTRAGRAVRGEGCVAADFDGDGHTDLLVTTAQSDELLWNNGNGTFTEGTRSHGIVSFGWHSGAAVTDVNGDGRPDLYVAGYTEQNGPIPGSMAGYPTNHLGVRDELFLNLGHRRFREVGARVGIDRAPYDHSLGAVFTDVNGDGRPDLYVANDEDPNRLYINEPGGPLGFHFVDRAKAAGVADPNAGMGIAAQNGALFVTNSRRQTHASYQKTPTSRFVRSRLQLPLNATAGWGASWIDVKNSGVPGLAVANGSIPMTRLRKDAQRLQLFVQHSDSLVDAGVLQRLRLNGRGLAAADFNNDGRVDLAVNSIGGPALLLENESPSAHWLGVELDRFAPGTSVTADGVTHEVQAGSSYLSSEDPRVHFGLGTSKRVRLLTVRYPNGTTVRLHNVRADRYIRVPEPR
jgi:Na+-translocating ferredoxin:NAD+ oxidoreductase RnfD subunit